MIAMDQELEKGSRDQVREHLHVAVEALFTATSHIRLLLEEAPKDWQTREAECHVLAAIQSVELARIKMRRRKRRPDGLVPKAAVSGVDPAFERGEHHVP